MAPSLKTLLITLEYPPQIGGVASYYSGMVSATDFSVAVADANTLPKSWLKMVPWLYQQTKRERYSHILVGQVLPLGTVAWLVHCLLGTPYIVFTHGMDILLPQQSARKRWLLHRILRNAQQVIASSHFTAEQIQQFDSSIQNITVINPATNYAAEQASEPVANLPVQFVLSVGRLVERKGFDQVIQAVAQVANIHYVIAGTGPDEERLRSLASKHSVDARVHFMSGLSNAQLAHLYQRCLCLAMPSRRLANGDVEGYGIVVLEANRFGKTAIGGRAGGMPDAIQDGVTGVLVDPLDTRALAEIIKRLMQDIPYRQQLETAAKHWSLQQTWSQRAQQLKSVLK